jgi:putative membrane protein
MEWKNIYRGVLMGISDLIPGVSGGTIAFILGIYDRLLAAISGFFSREWKKHLGFLVPLAMGIVITLLLFSRVIDFLLTNYFEATQFFFMGLIIGVLPYIMKTAEVKKNFTTRHIVILSVIGIALASTAFIQTSDAITPITALSVPSFFLLFFSGWIASMAMLLPGVSGSFILLLIGVYSTAINALSTLNIPVILTIGAGVMIGFIISSKLIRYLLIHYTYVTYAAIIGLILGSLFVVFPGVSGDTTTLLLSLATFTVGLVFTLLFSSPKKTDITDEL